MTEFEVKSQQVVSQESRLQGDQDALNIGTSQWENTNVDKAPLFLLYDWAILRVSCLDIHC